MLYSPFESIAQCEKKRQCWNMFEFAHRAQLAGQVALAAVRSRPEAMRYVHEVPIRSQLADAAVRVGCETIATRVVRLFYDPSSASVSSVSP